MAQPLSNDFSDLGGQESNDFSDLGGTPQHDFSDLGGVAVSDKSLTPETDSALGQVLKLARTPSPEWLQGFEGAVTELAKSVPGMIAQFPQMAYTGYELAHGDHVKAAGDILKQAIPLGEQIAKDIQQPVGTKEWWRSALQMGMMAAPALELLRPAEVIRPLEKPPIQGATDAIQPSDAQVQAGTTPLREQARPESEVPPTSDSDNVVGETQGTARELPREEPVSTSESVAAETPPTDEPSVDELGLLGIPKGMDESQFLEWYKKTGQGKHHTEGALERGLSMTPEELSKTYETKGLTPESMAVSDFRNMYDWYKEKSVSTGREPSTVSTLPEQKEPSAVSEPVSSPAVVDFEPTVDAAPPKVDYGNGSSGKPPPKSLVGPDTPPETNPEKTWAQRLTTKFRNWWENEWPRTYAAFKTEPDTPVVTIHQQFIKDPVDFMEHFADEPWWKNIKSMDEADIIDAEDKAVTRYRELVEQGVDPVKARAAAMYESPIKYVFAHRLKMEPIENAAADVLGVERPGFTGDPYLARLTNEEGKEIIDVTPSIGNIAGQLRRSIGHFDNSRVHATMKAGIAEGTQYDPVTKAVWLRERTGQQLISTANALKSLKDGGVLHDTAEAAKAAQIKGTKESPVLVRGFGAKNYWARNRQEAKFIQQNFSSAPSTSAAWRRINLLGNSYIRNPSLINPLPHVTKNMFFKYALARVGNTTFKSDVAEFASASKPDLLARFSKVFPVRESAIRMPQLTAREVGSWAEKITSKGLRINEPSQKFIFEKADPAMRYSLWKSYIRKGMSDQEAANHVFLDLVRYDENSGGLNFWKSIPFNYFSTWRTGTFVTMAKALRSHPYRTLLFLGGIEYLRELNYRRTGRWTHLPIDYMEAPLSEVVFKSTEVPKEIQAGKSPLKASATVPESAAAVAATTLLFGPGGGQAPSTIKDTMDMLRGDPMQRARVQNMFWGISQLFNIPQEYLAYKRDGNPNHLVNILTGAALGTHSALKYEPRRLGKWLPEWLPGLQRSQIVKQAEQIQDTLRQRTMKSQATYEGRHGIERAFQYGEAESQLEELQRSVNPTRQRSPMSPPRFR